MEQKLRRLPVMIVTVILAVAAFFLRKSQLKTAFDEIGVIPGSGRALVWIAIAVVILFAGYSYFKRDRKNFIWVVIFYKNQLSSADMLI